MASAFTRARRGFRAALLGALFTAGRLLPFGFALWLGDLLGRLAFALAGSEREKALRHLALAFPEWDGARCSRVARASFAGLGRSALELTQLGKLDLKSHVEWPQAEIDALRAALASGNGGVLVLSHIGNWELVGPRLMAEGFTGVAVGRRSGDPALARRIEAFRKRHGVPIVGRGDGASLREILRALRAGAFVAVLIDQDTRVNSVFVPFFGKPAHTPTAAEDLVRVSKGCCAMTFIHRRPDGGHLLHTEVVDTQAPDLTARLTARIEAEIRAHPADWVWMHERWKRRPETATTPLSAEIFDASSPSAAGGGLRVRSAEQMGCPKMGGLRVSSAEQMGCPKMGGKGGGR